MKWKNTRSSGKALGGRQEASAVTWRSGIRTYGHCERRQDSRVNAQSCALRQKCLEASKWYLISALACALDSTEIRSGTINVLSLPMISGLWRPTLWTRLACKSLQADDLCKVRCSSTNFLNCMAISRKMAGFSIPRKPWNKLRFSAADTKTKAQLYHVNIPRCP